MATLFGIFVLVIISWSVSEWAERHEQSGLFWATLVILLFMVLGSSGQFSFAASALMAGAFSMVGLYSVLFIEERYAPRTLWFRVIVDFDNYLVNALYVLIKFIAGLLTYVIKPAIKILPESPATDFQDLRQAIKHARWQQVTQLLNSASPLRRAFLVEHLADAGFNPKHYLAWMQAEPEHGLPYLLFGNAMIRWAWKARGDGTADTVPMRRFETFWQRLMVAGDALQKAAVLAPDDPEPFAGLLVVDRGLQQEREVLWGHFGQLVKRDKFHVAGHLSMLTDLEPKWGGTSEEMFEFAREIVAALPPGHPLYCLIPTAHIEQWVSDNMIDDDDDDSDDEDSLSLPNPYFSAPEIVAEITAAFEAFYHGNNRFVDNPPDDTAYRVLNIFAFCFHQAGRLDKTRELLKLIGTRATEYPWYYAEGVFFLSLHDTSYTYSKIYREAGLG